MKKKNIIFDYSKLKGYMKEKDVTQKELAKRSNICITTINQSLKYGKPFKIENIIRIAEVLNINLRDVAYYFFRQKV